MFDFFRRNQPTPKQIAKAVKKLTEPAGEEGPRVEAAERLLDWGTPEALFGLVRRFTISSKVITQDIEEKRLIVRMLVGQGDAAVAPILQFMKTHQQVDWPVRALSQIVPRAELVRHLIEIIETVALSEFAAAEHRVGLIRAVHDYVTPDMEELLAGFLDDSDDDVRIVAIEALGEVGESVRENLLQAFLDTDDRPRIRIRIAELFADRGWAVKGFRPKIEESLPDGFGLNSKGVIRRR